MNTVLASFCTALFFLAAPAFVASRYLWPLRVKWWAVAVGTGSVGWMMLVLGEQFTQRAWRQCEGSLFPAQMADSVGGCAMVELIPSYNLQFGWLKAFVYLIPWLALYGAIYLVRKRLARQGPSPPNKSLERTREG